MPLKLIFMGTPEFSLRTLEKIIDSEHKVECVYTQSPKKKSRGQKIKKSPVHLFAEKFSIPVRTPDKLDNDVELENFLKINPDVVVVVAYGKILPDKLLNIPKTPFINLHASLLPKWRGAAPIERSILNLDSQSGITIMKLVKKLDAGPFIKQIKVSINKNTTGENLRKKLSEIGAKAIIESLNLIEKGQENYLAQDENEASYAKKILKSETKINWNESAEKIVAKINAFSPKPGAWFQYNNYRIKVIEAKEVDKSGKIGSVIDEQLTIATKNKSIKIIKLQKEGKKIVDVEDFLKGNYINKGTQLN